MERRTDCESFEPKDNLTQSGQCQTDGHYLCKNCKHIAAFEDMLYYDNRLKYYPEKEKQSNDILNKNYGR